MTLTCLGLTPAIIIGRNKDSEAQIIASLKHVQFEAGLRAEDQARD